MNWPQIPESLAGLTSVELYALADSIQAARAANLSALATAEDEIEFDAWTAKERRIRTLAADTRGVELAAAEEAERAAAAEAAATLAAEQAAAAEAAANDDGGTGTGSDDGSGDGGTDGGGELAGVGAVQTSMATGATRVTETDRRASKWVSTGLNKNGPDKGAPFASNLALAETLSDMMEIVDAGDKTKHYLARVQDTFAPERILDPAKPWTTIQNLYDASDATLEAAFCPPATPIYDLACENSTRRPVMLGLPGFRTPERGAFTVLASPTLSSITGGYGQWDSADDADVNAIKTCTTIECVSPSTYEIYAIYRCLTVKNLMAMTFPELVAAYLNRLEAAAARYAEILLLEAMGTASTAISAPRLGYGGTTAIMSTILNYLALYQEQERWDVGVMDVWLPRWVMWAIKTDLYRRRRTDGVAQVASDGAVNALFTDAGVSVHWFMDRPSWALQVPAVATGNVLNLFPSSIDMLIHKRGKFALMSRGMNSIGVTGNNQYRLSDDLLKNQFTFFFESAEGLIDTDSCPAHKVRLPVCWNGVQIDDVVIDCEGNDYAGVGSGA